MEIFLKYKPQLKELQYPYINAFNDEQIKDIFSSKNRCFLLTWLLKKGNSEVFELDSSILPEATIADYLNESGCCKLSEKQSFVQGDGNINQQVKIFDRIFHNLELLNQSKNIDLSQNVSLHEPIENFLVRDINLAPAFGQLKVFTSNQRQEKLLLYQQEIENVKSRIDTSLINYDDVNLNDPLFEESIINKNVITIKELVKNLLGVSSLISEYGKQDQQEKNINFNENFAHDLDKCINETTSVLQYFKNVNLHKLINDESNQYFWNKLENDVTETTKNLDAMLSKTTKLLHDEKIINH